MKAAVYKGNRRFAVEEVDTPTPGPNQVLIKVKYSAICGTDVHAVLYDVVAPGSVMGHEYCGTVAQLGSDVTGWKVGDRVVGGGGTPPEGRRPFQREPRFNYRTMGYADTRIRAYAEHILMEEWQPVPIPEGVSDEAAALCEPCAVTVHAVRGSELRLGDSVVILGAGPIGLLCLQSVKAAGAGAVFVSEPAATRAQAALRLGADEVIDPTKEDVVSKVVSLTDGLGPQLVFDCAGAKSTLDQALTMVRRSGQVMLVALPWEETPLLPVDWMEREVKLRTTFGAVIGDWRIALELMRSGKVRVDPLLSEADFIPMDEIQQAFEALVKPTTQLQVVVKP